jgi:hypothetical protein
MPDADQVLLFIRQVLETPIQWAATFIGAIGILVLVTIRLKELVNKWTS